MPPPRNVNQQGLPPGNLNRDMHRFQGENLIRSQQEKSNLTRNMHGFPGENSIPSQQEKRLKPDTYPHYQTDGLMSNPPQLQVLTVLI